MKYHDLNKNQKLMAKAKSSRSTSGARDSYKWKYYSVIALIVLSSAFYIRWQIVNQTDSVFTDLWKMFGGSASEVSAAEASSEDESVQTNQIQHEPLPVKQQDVLLYLPLSTKGEVQMVGLKSKIEFKNSMFTALMSALVDRAPEKPGVFNSFTSGVKVNRAWIENNVLLVDFSREFENNKFGWRGLDLQIQQVLWTAFHLRQGEGRAVERVSILIAGKRRQKIGGEGLELKPFYSRSDLKKRITPKG